jgi:DNA-binding LacI/PurR family transcriptional regulator
MRLPIRRVSIRASVCEAGAVRTGAWVCLTDACALAALDYQQMLGVDMQGALSVMRFGDTAAYVAT